MSHGREKDAELERAKCLTLILLTSEEFELIQDALDDFDFAPSRLAFERGFRRGTLKLCEELKERTKK